MINKAIQYKRQNEDFRSPPVSGGVVFCTKEIKLREFQRIGMSTQLDIRRPMIVRILVYNLTLCRGKDSLKGTVLSRLRSPLSG